MATWKQAGEQAARLRRQHDMRLSAGQRSGNQHAAVVLLLRSHPMPVGLGQRGRTFNHSRIRPVQGTRSIEHIVPYREQSKHGKSRQRKASLFPFISGRFGILASEGCVPRVIGVKHQKILANTKPRQHLMCDTCSSPCFYCCHHNSSNRCFSHYEHSRW